jgi:hypothetical protein
MRHRSFLIILAAALVVLNLTANPAQAEPARVFVAAQGSDSNACTFAAPCRTFQHAHDVVAANGEIDVLDPAGYGALTINKSISIQGHGFAGLSVASGNGITVTTGAIKVHLRGLLIDGASTGAKGITCNIGALLMVEDTVIRNLTQTGLDMTVLSGTASLIVSNVLVASNHTGIAVGGSGSVNATLDNVVVADNSFGIATTNTGSGVVKLVVARSLVTGNQTGIDVAANVGSPAAEAFIRDTTLSKNSATAVVADVNAIVRIGRSTITQNGTGISTDDTSVPPAVVHSYGDNYLAGNIIDGAPTDTILPH